MRCPFCGHDDTQVKDSRPTEDNAAIRRRRFCPICNARFTTFERVQLRELTVVKSNGQREHFDRDKLLRSIRSPMSAMPLCTRTSPRRRTSTNSSAHWGLMPEQFQRDDRSI